MRVGQNNSVAMGTASAGTKKIGGVSLPDFNKFQYCTKTTPTMSDDKFKENITAQAEKDYAAGKFHTQASKNLQKQYVSVVSPDRKGFITDALTKLEKSPPVKAIDYLHLLLFGEVKYEKIDSGLSFAEFKDSNGELTATYSNGGWTFYGTKEEFARESDYFSIYNGAWNKAKAESEGKFVATA